MACCEAMIGDTASVQAIVAQTLQLEQAVLWAL
jgi:hypothetical protein